MTSPPLMVSPGLYEKAIMRGIDPKYVDLMLEVLGVTDVQSVGGADADGVSDDRGAIQHVDQLVEVSGGEVAFSPGRYRVASDLTIDSPVTMTPGAWIVPDDGVTVTLNGALHAGLYQIFDTSKGGSIRFAQGVSDVYWPEWFGAVTFDENGVRIDDAIPINQTIYGVRDVGGTIGIGHRYITQGPIDCTTQGSTPWKGLRFENKVRNSGDGVDDAICIFVNHTGVGFDCTGSADLEFWSVGLGANQNLDPIPAAGWLFSRNTSGASGGRHRLYNCRAQGYWTHGYVYEYGSEENVYHACFMSNARPNSPGWVSTTHNVAGISSTLAPIAVGPQSNLGHWFQGGSFQVAGGTSDTFYLEGAPGTSLDGGLWFAAAQSNGGGRSLVMCDGSLGGVSDFLHVGNVIAELTSFLPTYGVAFMGGTGITTTLVTVGAGAILRATDNAIYADDQNTISQITVGSSLEDGVAGFSFSELELSTIWAQSNILVVRGTSTRNLLIGRSSLWTINARDGDTWIDFTESGINTHGLTLPGIAPGDGVVSAGVADSGGAGFRLLRVPN